MTAFLSNFSACVGDWKKIQVSAVFFAIITGVANPDLVLDIFIATCSIPLELPCIRLHILTITVRHSRMIQSHP